MGETQKQRQTKGDSEVTSNKILGGAVKDGEMGKR